jgi:hypothetical protein
LVHLLSVFMSAIYTESLFALTCFYGLSLLAEARQVRIYRIDGAHLAKTGLKHGKPTTASHGDVSRPGAPPVVGSFWSKMKRIAVDPSGNVYRLLGASVCFGLAGLVRSNGILMAGYLLFERISSSPMPPFCCLISSTLRRRTITNWREFTPVLLRFMKHWLFSAFLGLIAVCPSLLFHLYGILLYCYSPLRVDDGNISHEETLSYGHHLQLPEVLETPNGSIRDITGMIRNGNVRLIIVHIF